MVGREIESFSREGFYQVLISYVLTLCASPRVIVRHESQWILPMIWDDAVSFNLTSVTSNAVTIHMVQSIKTMNAQVDRSKYRTLELLSPVTQLTLPDIFQGPYLQLDPPEPQTVTREDFSVIETIFDKSGWGFAAYASLLGAVLEDPEFSSLPLKISTPQPTTSSAGPLQTKSSTWQNLVKTSVTTTSSQPPSQSLIILASPLTHPINLGGVSRASEVFGVSSLLIPSLSIVAQRDFTSTSVSSQHHLDIRELPAPDIGAFCRTKRGEGWKVVGCEQTSDSVILGDYKGWKWPKRCILVLGSEREGIPADVLAECDDCVEVPQKGEIRSLNVQTAGAIAMFEWNRQWKK
jgi:tRNA guanosine-2'-O-methyltransferase